MNKDQILDAQFKYIEDILAKIWKNPNAPPFHEPVDPIKLNVPDYPEKIKNPMDLSTIKTKLKQKQYVGPNDLRDDFKLMVNNCLTYNGRESMIYKMAHELDKQFNQLFSKIPNEDSLSKVKRKTEPIISKLPASEKKIKRICKGNISLEEQKRCEYIIGELFKPKYQNVVWPFMEPITDELIPGYSKIIKNPTDLKSIRKKLTEMQFDSSEDFYKEIKIMISNCFKFNADVKKIYDCGLELDEIVEGLFAREKGTKEQLINKITEIRNKINTLEREALIYEEKLSAEDKSQIVTEKEYSLDERLDIGTKITELNQIQTTKIAQIINKTGVHLDFVGRNEVEIDLRTLPDKCVGEIKEYLENVCEAKNTRCS